MTQRDDDVGQQEAKLKSDKLFEEWAKDYLGSRAKRGQDAGSGRSDAEDSQATEAPNYTEAAD